MGKPCHTGCIDMVYHLFASYIKLLRVLSHLLQWYGLSPVWLQMIYKNAILSESFVTLTALIWFFPRVIPHMHGFKIIIVWESLVTMAALIRSLPSVCPYMAYKITISWECLVILATLVCFLSIVCSYMTHKIIIIWLLPSV